MAGTIVKEVEAKSILRKHKRIDSWFVSRYGMNLYRGCTHNCIYCDGRAERYYVEGEFGSNVTVKVNAVDVLRRELDPRRKRVPLKRGYLMIGGGVGDSYQPAEEKYELTRRVLQLVNEFNFPVSILTKSTLIERDLDVIKKINANTRAIISMSFSSVDDRLSALFEPGVPLASERLQTLAKVKAAGIACGMFLMPVIPFISDTPKYIEMAIRKATEIGLDFIIFSGMTLREGVQKQYFMDRLTQKLPQLAVEYDTIYYDNPYGQANDQYYQSIQSTFLHYAKKYRIPIRIPVHLYNDLMDENDLVVVLLGQMDYLLKIRNASSTFGYASHVVSKIKEPLSQIKNELRSMNGIGPITERIIREILLTRRCTYYSKLMRLDGVE